MGLLSIARWVFAGKGRQSAGQRAAPIRPGAPACTVVGHRAGPLLVQRSETPYWQTHWKKKGRNYHGHFFTPYGSWRGEIREGRGRIQAWAYGLPQRVLNGRHSACFRPAGVDKHEVHFAIQPRDVDAAILSVERTIREAFQ